MSQKRPADSVRELGSEDVTKAAIRDVIWKYIEENDLADFPRPVTRRIPNVKGAATAAEMIPTMEQFKKAHTIKINPDKPQEQARYLTIDAGKTLLVPTPRLRTGLFNRIEPPADASKEILRICSTSQGVREYSKPISLEDKVKVDLVIVGSVAVSKSGLRIGKGEGFADLEWAMMTAMGAVNKDTVVITTVHDCQIVDIPEKLIEDHDLTVDYIVTQTEIIDCKNSRPKPTGIIWSKLEPVKLRRIPILRKIMLSEKEAGKDVTLKEGKEFDFEAAEKEDEERAKREEEEGEDGDRDRRRRYNRYRRGGYRRYGGRGRGRGGRRGGPGRDRTESEGEEGEEGRKEKGDGEGTDGEGADRPKRRYNRRFQRRRRQPRRDRDSVGDGEGDKKENGSDKEGSESEGEGKDRRRPRNQGQRRFRPRRSRQPTIFVGGLPRSLRVSAFKTEVRGKDVDPLRVVWYGGSGHAFLQFQNQDLMDSALEALADLDINGKKLRVEEAHQNRGGKGKSEDENAQNGDATNEEHEVKKEASSVD